MSPDLWLILSFAVLLALGVPVAFALGLSGAIGIIAGLSPDMLATLGTNTYNGVAKYPLIAIPLFILAGAIMNSSSLSRRLIAFASALFGFINSSQQIFFDVFKAPQLFTTVFAAIAGGIAVASLLNSRLVERLGMPIEPEASERATAANPKDLPKQQAALAFWLSRKYGVAPEPLSVLVAEAFAVGHGAVPQGIRLSVCNASGDDRLLLEGVEALASALGQGMDIAAMGA